MTRSSPSSDTSLGWRGAAGRSGVLWSRQVIRLARQGAMPAAVAAHGECTSRYSPSAAVLRRRLSCPQLASRPVRRGAHEPGVRIGGGRTPRAEDVWRNWCSRLRFSPASSAWRALRGLPQALRISHSTGCRTARLVAFAALLSDPSAGRRRRASRKFAGRGSRPHLPRSQHFDMCSAAPGSCVSVRPPRATRIQQATRRSRLHGLVTGRPHRQCS